MHRAIRRLSSGAPIRTALYDLHQELGGKMVPFAGYELPVLYNGLGVATEHKHCRTPGCASLFDVSHMGQIEWRGKDRVKFLERVLVGDVAGLGSGEGRLSLLVNPDGGIVDDAVLANAGDYIYMVVNGACKHGDMAYFKEVMASSGDDVDMNYRGDDRQLLALQGDGAKEALVPLLPVDFKMDQMAFMTGVDVKVAGKYDCRVTRCGYTGEDGFEIAMDKEDAITVAQLLLNSTAADVKPCGLGARDSLRLEAGLCLYGHDLDTSIDPIEATLLWTIGPKGARRRTEQGFAGAHNILNSDGSPLKKGKKRVGFFGHSAPVREGAKIFDAAGAEIGVVTSGTVSPTLGKPIAMGYVDIPNSKLGTEVHLGVRKKMLPTTVTKMPFVPTNYWRVPE